MAIGTLLIGIASGMALQRALTVGVVEYVTDVGSDMLNIGKKIIGYDDMTYAQQELEKIIDAMKARSMQDLDLSNNAPETEPEATDDDADAEPTDDHVKASPVEAEANDTAIEEAPEQSNRAVIDKFVNFHYRPL